MDTAYSILGFIGVIIFSIFVIAFLFAGLVLSIVGAIIRSANQAGRAAVIPTGLVVGYQAFQDWRDRKSRGIY